MFLATEMPFETVKFLECYVASGANLFQRCGALIKNTYFEDHCHCTLHSLDLLHTFFMPSDLMGRSI